MKKISCVGFHATGSGAVDDFLREFNNIEAAKYGVECRFLQDPDGISDLEYHLIENKHRLNSGFAIKKFLKLAQNEKRGYEKIFGKNWIPWVQSYIDELSNFKYKGYWRADINNQNIIKKYMYYFRRVINMMLPKRIRKTKYYNYFPNEITYFSNISKKDFYNITKNKINELCDIMNKDNKEYVVLDQAFSPQNIDKYFNYISDIKIIVVDRDPRDVYINDIIINKDYVLPRDINMFCEVFKYSRINSNYVNKNILKINFEDIIYDYENTTQKIIDFLELKEENHILKRKVFIPEKSKNNTKLWLKYPQYNNEIKIIEDKLKDYLYKY